ncbi:hypothetical protein [Pseudonocardia sp. MH-G8]|nr:hypothetical protein [Pseudonocardia sp. MH-G8]
MHPDPERAPAFGDDLLAAPPGAMISMMIDVAFRTGPFEAAAS